MNKPSANQRYKESKSEMPFKEWLIGQQKEGNLENHFNAIGGKMSSKPKVTLKTSKAKMIKIGVLGVVAVSVLVYGIYAVSKNLEKESS